MMIENAINLFQRKQWWNGRKYSELVSEDKTLNNKELKVNIIASSNDGERKNKFMVKKFASETSKMILDKNKRINKHKILKT